MGWLLVAAVVAVVELQGQLGLGFHRPCVPLLYEDGKVKKEPRERRGSKVTTAVLSMK